MTATPPQKRPPRKPATHTPRRNQTGRQIKRLVCFVEVKDRILEGRPMAEIAHFIQHSRHELEHLKLNTVLQLLSVYKRSIPPADVLAHKNPRVVLDAHKRIEAGLNELEEMEGLYRLQRGRVEMALKTEQSKQELGVDLKNEIKTAREILEASIEIKEQMGLIEGKKKELTNQLNVQLNQQTTNQVIQAPSQGESIKDALKDPAKRRSVASMLKGLLAAGDAKQERKLDPSE